MSGVLAHKLHKIFKDVKQSYAVIVNKRGLLHGIHFLAH
jgi:hypothetical protein